MTVDLEPLNKEKDYWDKYIKENADTFGKDFEKVMGGFAEAANHAKMRIDVEGAKIWRPLMDMTKLHQKMM